MKKYVLAVFVLFAAFTLHAQESILASGNEASGSGGSLSYSVGQVVYSAYSESNGTVSEGVQQAYEISVALAIGSLDAAEFELSAYPNPTLDVLNLKVSKAQVENCSFQLFNIEGKLLETKKLTEETTIIHMEAYDPAVYFIHVSDNQKQIKSFKIIKN